MLVLVALRAPQLWPLFGELMVSHKLLERVSPVTRGKSMSAYHLNLTSYTVCRRLGAHLVSLPSLGSVSELSGA
jgi:hypothetical protein